MSMYSIDPSIKTVYSTFTIDKYMIDDMKIPVEEIKWQANVTNMNQIVREVGPTMTDLVIKLYPPEPAGKFNIRMSAAGIPNEYARLMARIDRLEDELRYVKNSQSLYAPVYDLSAKRESQ